MLIIKALVQRVDVRCLCTNVKDSEHVAGTFEVRNGADGVE